MTTTTLTYLGILIKKINGEIQINQKKYLERLLDKWGMLDCKGCKTPMDSNFNIDEKIEVDMSYEHQCRSLIGSLMYATVGSRPDLAMAVYYLSRFQSRPNKNLWQALKRILRYVKQTLEYSLIYRRHNFEFSLIGYADADFARDSDRKSTSGYLFKLFDNTIIWKSRKQSTVSLSTTEAEFVSLCEATMEACWIKKLLLDLNIDIDCIHVFEDNQSTIKAVSNYDQKRLKHMDVKYNFIKEKVEQKLIDIVYIKTDEQLADILTKPVSKNKLETFVKDIGLEVRN